MKKTILAVIACLGLIAATGQPAQAAGNNLYNLGGNVTDVQSSTMDLIKGNARDKVEESGKKFGGEVLGKDSNYAKKMTSIKGVKDAKSQLSVSKMQESAEKQLCAIAGAWAAQAKSVFNSVKSEIKSKVKGKIKSVIGG